MIDVAPNSWGDWAGHVFIAEWGDLSPPTNPIRGENPAQGFQVVRVDPDSGEVTPFVANFGGGPASVQQHVGQGIERPFDVQFGPDGAMYIVDYGIVEIDMSRKPPYDYKAGTGVIWKVSLKDKSPGKKK
jgi:glucose/arabinose dehydrogenase